MMEIMVFKHVCKFHALDLLTLGINKGFLTLRTGHLYFLQGETNSYSSFSIFQGKKKVNKHNHIFKNYPMFLILGNPYQS